jgi:cytochrome c-type biogenesis protein CcsB
MADNASLAHVSDLLFTSAIATYTIAMACYTAEYAFGRKGRVAAIGPVSRSAVAAQAPMESLESEPDRVLVGASTGGSSRASSRSSASSAGASSAGSSPRPPIGRIDPADAPSRSGDRLGRAAVIITILGAVLHLTSVTLRGVAVDRVPWGNMYEFAAVAGLVAVLAFLAIVMRMPQIRYLGGFALFPVVIVMFLAGTVWYVKASPLVPALQSYWLAIHVSAAASSEGVFMTSSVLTVLYLVRSRYDRRVNAGDGAPLTGRAAIGARLPSAASLDKAAYRAAAFAFPIYTFAVICGAIWAEAAWGRYWGWDPKEVWAFIVWVLYAAYLHARATAGWRGRAAAWINILGFAAMTFNFFVVNVVIAGLHSYSGLNS